MDKITNAGIYVFSELDAQDLGIPDLREAPVSLAPVLRERARREYDAIGMMPWFEVTHEDAARRERLGDALSLMVFDVHRED